MSLLSMLLSMLLSILRLLDEAVGIIQGA